MLFNLTGQGVSEPVRPDARYQPLMTSEGGGIGRLRRHIAANAATTEHFKSSSWLALTSQRLNLGDGKRAQSGEKSVPDDFLLLCSFPSALTPLPTSATAPKCASAPPPHITQSLKLSQEPVSLHPPPNPAILPSLAPLFPSPPLPPHTTPSPCAPPSAFQHDKPHGISLVL